MKVVLFYFALFILYSFIGWIIEMITENVLNKRFSNRGFLIGPYCPIYGVCSLLMIILLSNYRNDVLILFCMSIIICTIGEYLTSVIMEKLFKARWWDYYNEPFNLNGRVCLVNSIGFGFLGVFLIKFINPFFVELIEKINPLVFFIIFASIFILFIVDLFFSLKVANKVKSTFLKCKKDQTNLFNKKVQEELIKNNFLIKRLFVAFPLFKDNIFKKSKNL